MGRINFGRVVLSGIIIAAIVDIVEGISNGWLLAAQWEVALKALNQPMFSAAQIIAFNIYGLIIGFMAAWIYAGFRPRFRPGHRTAILAGLTTWVLGYFLPYYTLWLVGVPFGLMVTLGIVGLVEIVVATLVGAWFYREEA